MPSSRVVIPLGCCLAAGLASLFAAVATAVPVTEIPIGDEFLDVEYFAGTGEHTSYVIVDFAETAGPSFAFGYQWDIAVDSYTMLEAIADAGDLDFSATPFDFGNGTVFLIDNFSYAREGDVFVGDPQKYWRFDLGNYDGLGVNWADSGTGASSRTILPDSFDGWYNFNPFPPPDEVLRVTVPTVGLATEDGADFDIDGDVDGDDFLIWQQGYGRPDAKFAEGDANGDGQVNGLDFLIWQSGYGTPLDKSLTALPEPSTGLLLVACLIGAAGRYRSRRRG